MSGISKNFGAVSAISGLSLDIADGECFVLLGPTGAGKTTTLRLLAGLEAPDAGTITIAGQNVTTAPPAARDVAFVFQQYSLYPHLSVYDNLAFPLKAPGRRLDNRAIKARVAEVASLLRIDDKLNNRATQLSGGQMQRVAIGRALVRRPAIFLMDEPLSSLDAKLRSDLRIELKRIQETLKATILYVTHDHAEAMTLGNRIGVLERGRLVQAGTPREVYENPVNVHVAARLGTPTINLVPRGVFAGEAAPTETATIGVRTEHLRITKNASGNGGADTGSNNNTVGKVTWIEHLGDQNHVHIAIGGEKLVSLAKPDSGIETGDVVAVNLVSPLFFDVAGDRLQSNRMR